MKMKNKDKTIYLYKCINIFIKYHLIQEIIKN
jgi:hypothetical protein